MEKSELRLLVIEDEKKLCDMIAKSLHMAGYEVDMCNDGERALDMIYTELYDLIVRDLNLTGLDGMEILRELRKENEETKVLIPVSYTHLPECIRCGSCVKSCPTNAICYHYGFSRRNS